MEQSLVLQQRASSGPKPPTSHLPRLLLCELASNLGEGDGTLKSSAANRLLLTSARLIPFRFLCPLSSPPHNAMQGRREDGGGR